MGKGKVNFSNRVTISKLLYSFSGNCKYMQINQNEYFKLKNESAGAPINMAMKRRNSYRMP